MRIRPTGKSAPKKQTQAHTVTEHRKQIQSTLRQLHVLQSQIYQLNVPQNPHSSSPVKKQIKQLSYLYENMTKPKKKNNLNIKSKDIQLAMRIMNNEWSHGVVLQEQILDQKLKTGGKFTLIPTQDKSYKMEKNKLKQKFVNLTDNNFNLNLLTDNQQIQNISTQNLYNFINYNECDNFDPIQQAYHMFLNKEGKFDIRKYNQFNQSLNLPKVKSFNTFISAIQQAIGDTQQEKDTITLEMFRKLITMDF